MAARHAQRALRGMWEHPSLSRCSDCPGNPALVSETRVRFVGGNLSTEATAARERWPRCVCTPTPAWP